MRDGNLKIEKKDFLWNTVGTFLYSTTSLFLNFFVINILGGEIGGLFSFGYSTLAYVVYIISYFGIRSYHSIDVKNKYSFFDYLGVRLITTFISIIFGITYIYVMYFRHIYSFDKSIFLLIIIFSGVFEGFFDVYEGEFQRRGELYKAGIGLFFRTLIFILVFIILLCITKNIIISSIFSVLSKLISGIFFEVCILKNYGKFSFDFRKIKIMIIELLPFFLITLLDGFIHSVSKFSIDLYLNDSVSGVFNLLFIPSNIIYMLCMFVMRPLVTPISNMYSSDLINYNNVSKKILKYSIIIAGIVILLSISFGKLYLYIIDILTNNTYNMSNSNEIFITFLLVMIAGIFYTINTPIYFMLIIEEKKKYLLTIYIVVFFVSIIVSNIFVKIYGLVGASVSFLIIMFLLNFLIMGGKFFRGKINYGK